MSFEPPLHCFAWHVFSLVSALNCPRFRTMRNVMAKGEFDKEIDQNHLDEIDGAPSAMLFYFLPMIYQLRSTTGFKSPRQLTHVGMVFDSCVTFVRSRTGGFRPPQAKVLHPLLHPLQAMRQKGARRKHSNALEKCASAHDGKMRDSVIQVCAPSDSRIAMRDRPCSCGCGCGCNCLRLCTSTAVQNNNCQPGGRVGDS